MNPRVKLLRELVADGLYVVDEVAVADAVVLRVTVRWAVPGWPFAGPSASRSHTCARFVRIGGCPRSVVDAVAG